jgi:hypothetical protein
MWQIQPRKHGLSHAAVTFTIEMQPIFMNES